MMEIRGVLDRLGFALCIVAASVCIGLHVATFLIILQPGWIFPVFALIAGAVICANVVGSRPRFTLPDRKVAILGGALLVYSIFTFVYFYKKTGGASAVEIVGGQYVSEYKGHVIRTISEYEYRMFPNLWTRFMSAWIAMMAVFCTSAFASSQSLGKRR
jgi:hypothetical protein